MTDEFVNVDTLDPPEEPLATEPDHSPDHGRGSRDRVIGGVAGLIAVQLGLNPMWVRLFFVVLGLVGGVGVVLYAGLWMALPHPEPSPYLRPLGTVVLVAGLPLFLVLSGVPAASGPFAIIALLAGVALLLWQPPMPVRSRTGHTEAILTRPLAPSDENAAPIDAVDVDGTDDADGEPNTPTASARLARRVRRERRSSILGRATLGLAMSVAAIAALIDANNGGRLYPEQWLGLATVVCGAGLVVGTVRGYARWLIVPAIGFAAAGVVGGQFARLDIPVGNAFGDRYVRVEAASTVTNYRLTRGYADGYISVEEDLTRDVTVDAKILSGTLTINVPPDIRVELDARTPDGATASSAASTTMDGDTMVVGPADGHVVHINARVEHGDVIVTNWEPWVEPDPDAVVYPLDESDTAPWEVERTPISDEIEVSDNGYVIVLYGQAIIGPDNRVVQAQYGSTQDGSVTTLMTDSGDFQLTGGILIDPYASVWDLDAIRASLGIASDAAPASSVPTTPRGGGTAPPVPVPATPRETAPPVPATVPSTDPVVSLGPDVSSLGTTGPGTAP